jgi:S1-C subfamily serine protease
MKLLLALICFIVLLATTPSWAAKPVPVSNLAGISADIAIPSVFRILIPSKNRIGTGFLHKSGYVITAAHVIEGCYANELMLFDFQGNRINISSITLNMDLDIAILKADNPPKVKTLPLSKDNNFKIGSQLSVWGYPEGYTGKAPLITAGYLSGIENDAMRMLEGKVIPRFVINSTFNNGNSGSPLLDIEKEEVVGFVAAKLAPMPLTIASALNALKNQGSGFIYTAKNEKGEELKLSEAQIIEMVMQYLRSQTQLGMGEAVTIDTLRRFLLSQKIEP